MSRSPKYTELREAIQAMAVGDPPLRWALDSVNIHSVRTLLRDWSYDAPRRVYRTFVANGYFHVTRVL